ncbi:MAG: NAD-dependent epimerase/dehydratase family protein [Rhodospirillales bacterium]|nr:NAD-dependent epimerase/dehydratase family protein [Rhodospirillales bacterium]
MTTLVTGAGLIGASFARQAAKRDEKVIFLDPIPRAEYLKSMLGDGGWELVQEDVRQLPALLKVINAKNVDTIIHTAAPSATGPPTRCMMASA